MTKTKRKNQYEKLFKTKAHEKNGITLIALVVTIIVLVIIASITTAVLLRRQRADWKSKTYKICS